MLQDILLIANEVVDRLCLHRHLSVYSQGRGHGIFGPRSLPAPCFHALSRGQCIREGGGELSRGGGRYGIWGGRVYRGYIPYPRNGGHFGGQYASCWNTFLCCTMKIFHTQTSISVFIMPSIASAAFTINISVVVRSHHSL